MHYLWSASSKVPLTFDFHCTDSDGSSLAAGQTRGKSICFITQATEEIELG